MSTIQESKSSITQAQIHQYQVESPQEWQARMKKEAELQKEDEQRKTTEIKKEDFFKSKNFKKALVAVGLTALAAFGVKACTDSSSEVTTTTPTPIPETTKVVLKTPTTLPTASPTSIPEATLTATSTEIAKWQPHFFEEKTLANGETIWTSSYSSAEKFLRTFHADRFYETKDNTEVLTEEGKRVTEVMADGATLLTVVDNGFSLEVARSMSIDLPYKQASSDVMIVMLAGITDGLDIDIPVPQEELKNFTDLAQTVEFNAVKLPDATVLTTQTLLNHLHEMESVK